MLQRSGHARQLDTKLAPFKRLRGTRAPRRGWVKAIRSALAMTQSQLASRLQVSQPTVDGFERAEESGAITLRTLRRTAAALDCEVVYALVPRRRLQEMLAARAREVAEEMVRRTDRSMRLEAQGVAAAERRRQVRDLARELAARPPRGFWTKP
jgi:predicted DNA-binding mobile mystery protein A